ncbi:sigma-70 family RNA polymerase sigma factor [Aeromicrobium sp. NPDC092404]|uniref:sigma-70 family RNA polymerase sigma factor n=1 Tax=Aeromicrobium sp. NPDC092404 TaxID=3154976 RepID=UPI003435B6B6
MTAAATPLTAELADLSITELEDAELIALARNGSDDAYAALFRRHTYAAHRLARHLGQREEAEDVVAESFAQVLDLFRRGKGPDRAFRAYLFTSIRHESARRAKARQRVMPTADERQIDSVVPFGAGQLEAFEQSAIRGAYESLPARWRTVLWHLDVEGRKPQELGPLLKLSPNSVSALAYRARSGLREAYLQQHVNEQGPAPSRACGEVRARLSAYVRQTASAREQASIAGHLEGCAACSAIDSDLRIVNREVGAVRVSAALLVSLLGLVGAAFASVWASLTANVVALGKAGLAVLAPPAAVAAFTAASVIGFGATEATEPMRYPMPVQADGPRAERAGIPGGPLPAAAKQSEPSKSVTKTVGRTTLKTRPKATASAGAGASSPGTKPGTSPGSEPTSPPKVIAAVGSAVTVQVDESGVRARIASVTAEVPSRLLGSLLSLGTTN